MFKAIIRVIAIASGNNLAKLVLAYLPAVHFVFIRNIITVLFSFTLNIKTPKHEVIRALKHKKLLVLLLVPCALGYISTVTYYLAMKSLPISIMMPINNMMGIVFTIIVGLIVFKETVTFRTVFTILALVPAALLVAITDLGELQFIEMKGVILLVISNSLLAFDVHWTKRQMQYANILTINLIKTVMVLFISLVAVLVTPISFSDTLDLLTVNLMILIAIISSVSVIQTTLSMLVLRDLGVNKSTLFNSLIPGLSVVIAVIFTDESLILTQWIGVVLTIVVLYLSMKNKEAKL